MIFLSLGAEVVKRIEAYDQEDLTDVLLMSNKHLDQGFALQEVICAWAVSTSLSASLTQRLFFRRC